MAIQQRRQNTSNPFLGAPSKTVKLHWRPSESAATPTQEAPKPPVSPSMRTTNRVALLAAFILAVGLLGLVSIWLFVR